MDFPQQYIMYVSRLIALISNSRAFLRKSLESSSMCLGAWTFIHCSEEHPHRASNALCEAPPRPFFCEYAVSGSARDGTLTHFSGVGRPSQREAGEN
jgi:hypothetical protein